MVPRASDKGKRRHARVLGDRPRTVTIAPSSLDPALRPRGRKAIPMEKGFDPRPIESKWYAHWEASGTFAPHGSGAPYCILLPPPNVTGTLHMGHAFQMTIMDALIRYNRMHGRRTLWQGGTDH